MNSLILTLQLDEDSQAHFERLRRVHYPPERNQINAHLTIFHQLPDTEAIAGTLREFAASQTAFSLELSGLRSLGRGVAYLLSSSILMNLHRRLSESFEEHLTAQDRQRFQPHVVVQNKVTASQARALLAELQQDFTPMTIEARGLELWIYRNGPWEHKRTFAFSRSPSLHEFKD